MTTWDVRRACQPLWRSRPGISLGRLACLDPGDCGEAEHAMEHGRNKIACGTGTGVNCVPLCPDTRRNTGDTGGTPVPHYAPETEHVFRLSGTPAEHVAEHERNRMTHCAACQAIVHPLWPTCMVCKEPRDGAQTLPPPEIPAPATPVPAPPALPCMVTVRWSREKGWIDLYNPIEQCWVTIQAKGNPEWVYDRLKRGRGQA